MRPGIVFLSCALALSADSTSKDLLHSSAVGDLLHKFDVSRQQAAAAPTVTMVKASPKLNAATSAKPRVNCFTCMQTINTVKAAGQGNSPWGGRC